MPSRYSALMPSGSKWTGSGNRAVELACDAFAAMHADAVRVGHRLLTRDADRVFLGFDLQAALIDAWQLDDREKIAALLEDVDGRERPLAGGLVLQPVAGQTGLERPLQIEQCLKWINESRDHVRTPLCDFAEGARTVLDALARLRGNSIWFWLWHCQEETAKKF